MYNEKPYISVNILSSQIEDNTEIYYKYQKRDENIHLVFKIMNKENFYVYAWYDPETNLPFYIGKGKNKRAWDVSYKARNKFFMRKYNKLKQNGFEPYVELLHQNLTEDKALEIEHELIEQYKPYFEGGILTNLSYSEGGKSTISPTTKELLSVNSIGEKNSMSKFKEDDIVQCFELMIKGLSNKEIFEKTNVPAHIVSDLRYGKKWKHVYNRYSENLKGIKVSGLNNYGLTFETKLEIIHEIYTRDSKILLKDIALKYNLKETAVVSINLKRQWKDIWKYYIDNNKS